MEQPAAEGACRDGPRNDRRISANHETSTAIIGHPMWRAWIPFWHAGVSPYSGDVDLLFTGLLFASALVLGLLFFLLALFCVRYRAGNHIDRGGRVKAKAGTGRSAGRRRRSWHFSACSSGGPACFSNATGPTPTNYRYSSLPSSGCGRFSIPAANPKSTRCIFRCIIRSG